jgi:betaine-aldehyde dehydrogenase
LQHSSFELAVDQALNGGYFHAGQVCSAGSRILVHNNIKEKFEKALIERVGNSNCCTIIFSNFHIFFNFISMFWRNHWTHFCVTIIIERVGKIKLGNGFDSDTEMGPVISPEHRDKIEKYMKVAKDDGATTLCSGEITGPISVSLSNPLPNLIFPTRSIKAFSNFSFILL